MANSTYLLGGTSDTGAYYFYALRRDDDGNLFIRRDDVTNDTNILDVFGENKPSDFDGEFIDFDFDEGRNLNHTLKYTADEVKYEQWFWDTKLVSFYLDHDDGQLVAAYGKENKWLSNDDQIIVNQASVPNDFTLELFGINKHLNAYEKLIFAGWNGIDPVVLINEGTITGTSAETAALTIAGEYPYGITFVNLGIIEGAPEYYTSENISGIPGTAIDINVPCALLYNDSVGTINGGRALSGNPEDDGRAIVGISNVVVLTNNGQIGSTI